MGESKIQWTRYTFNGWLGCEPVSEACDNCYIETQPPLFFRPKAKGGAIKLGDMPVMTSAATWRNPLAWNRKAEREGARERVFAFSLGDVFDQRMPDDARDALMDLIAGTPNLVWLVLTKRADAMYRYLTNWYSQDGWFHLHRGKPLSNLHVGCTVESNKWAKVRLPKLILTPAASRFISCEPQMESVNFCPWLATGKIHQVITGGESAGRRKMPVRPYDLLWARDIIEQCRSFEVAAFVKQLGEKPTAAGRAFKLADKHGGDWDEWPSDFGDIRVREFAQLTAKD